MFDMYFSCSSAFGRIRNPKSQAHIGIGAFNLIRSAVYRAVEGHQRIRMRPDDDLKLGKIIKLAGYRQDFVDARGSIAVEWYRSSPRRFAGWRRTHFRGPITTYR